MKARITSRWWQPLFLVLSLTWLFAPALHGAALHSVRFISNYEGTGQPYGWLFRVCDATAALLIIGVLLYGKLTKMDRLLKRLLLLTAGLTIVDAIFAVTCRPGFTGCHETASLARTIHDWESSLSALALFATVVRYAAVSKSTISWLFAAGQAVFMVVVLGVGGSQVPGLALGQYAYQVAGLIWMAWVVGRHQPPLVLPASATVIRHGFAIWAAVAGAVSLFVSAAHLHLYGRDTALLLGAVPHSPWLHPFTVVIGVSMIYLARQLWRGERAAGALLLVLFAVEVLRFAIIQPSSPVLAVYLFSFVALFMVRQAFDRNIMALSWRNRSVDALTVVVAVAAPVAVMLVAAIATGHDSRVSGLLDRPHSLAAVQVLVGSTALLALYSLFRPAAAKAGPVISPADIEALLAHYATDSEDYAKRWPYDKTYFSDPAIKGFVAYRLVAGTAFVLADPVASPRWRAVLWQRFSNYCRRNGWSVCVLLVPNDSRGLYDNMNTLPIGASAVVDIEKFVTATARDKWWRWQTNRAAKAGYRYECLAAPYDTGTMRALRAVSDEWLGREGHQEQGFALGSFDEEYIQASRLHVLRNETGDIIAFANEPPIFNGLRQTTVDLIRFKPEYDNAMPTLLSGALRMWHDEGRYERFDLGFVPLAEVTSAPAKVIRRVARSRFSAAGLQQFKNKFKPDWRQNYMAYNGDYVDLATMAARLERALQAEPADDK